MHYCFESKTLYTLFHSLFPETRENCETAESLVRQITQTPVLSEKERLPLLEALLQGEMFFPPTQGPKLLSTLEALRKSFILSSEHIDHCFLSLPATPKNQFLKKALHLYLESPLAYDSTAERWAAIEALKNKSVSRSFGEEWIFVKESGSPLFEELAKAFAYAPGVRETRVTDFSKTRPFSQTSSLPIQRGNALSALEATALAIAHAATPSSQPILVPFQGTKEKEAYLKQRLSSLGLTVTLFSVEEESLPRDFFSELRKCKEIPLATRLEIWHEAKKEWANVPSSFSFQQVIERLIARKALEPTLANTLATLLHTKETRPPAFHPPADVWILPWVCVPTDPARQIAFCDESAVRSNRHQLLLTHSEIETLFLEGFSLPRAKEYKEGKGKVLETLVTSGVAVFSTLESHELEAFPHQEILLDQPLHQKKEPPAPVLFPSLMPSYFSATQLETYAACPARYLYANRLRLRKELLSEDRTALLFGQCAHLALENFLKDPLTSGLEKERWPEKLLSFFEDGLKTIAPHMDPKHTLYKLLREMFKPLAASFSALENQLHGIFGNSVPTHFEKDFKLVFEGKTFVGKIDRIDTLPDGSLLVIDYKTGTVDFSPEHIKKGTHFQALLYLEATEQLFSKNVAGVLFYDLKQQELRRGLFLEEHLSKETKKALTRGHVLPKDKLDLLKKTGFTFLAQICQSISDGRFDPSPSPEACRYCDYRSYCRSAHV